MSAAASTPQIEKKVLVPIATGSEEIEAVSIIDTLRRAGAKVIVASSENELKVVCSRGVKLEADVLLKDIPLTEDFDAIAVPGGLTGAERLRDNDHLKSLLERQSNSNRLVSAICAAPALVLETHGLLKDKKATAHPNFFQKLSSPTEGRIVKDGNFLTSRAPGTSIEFALAIIEELYGKEKATEVAAPMLVLKA